MTLVSVPLKEVDGVPVSRTFLDDNPSLKVGSHDNQTLVTLRFFNKTFTVEAKALRPRFKAPSGSSP
jgi:hypothetical protein